MDGSLQATGVLSSCPKNQELVAEVAANLTALETLAKSQREAREEGDNARAQQLDQELDLIFAEKERSVGRWQEHVREHGC